MPTSLNQLLKCSEHPQLKGKPALKMHFHALETNDLSDFLKIVFKIAVEHLMFDVFHGLYV